MNYIKLNRQPLQHTLHIEAQLWLVLPRNWFLLTIKIVAIKYYNIEFNLYAIVGPRTNHLPRMLEGDRPPRSLTISSSCSLPSKQRPLLFTLTSELALLLVARGESETLIVLLLVGPDLTLYIDDAGIFVINGRRLPGMLLLISCSKNSNQKSDE